jgi:hypothetical protein
VVRQQPGDELVLGAAIGLSSDAVRPFLRSLRGAGYAGPIGLLVDPALKKQLLNEPLAAGVTLIGARRYLPFRLRMLERPWMLRWLWSPIERVSWRLRRLLGKLARGSGQRFALQFWIARWVCTPMEARFLSYRRFLEVHPHRRVLLTDVRDVVFQRDPFADLPSSGLAVSLESADYTIATEHHNAHWIERAYGRKMLERIGDNRVSCVGVTYGDGSAIWRYLVLVTEEILRLSPSQLGIGGADTAIHNVLIWTGQLGSVHQLETLASPVATFNGIDQQAVRISDAGTVLNRDGSEPSILHQYDRIAGLGSSLLRVLASSAPRSRPARTNPSFPPYVSDS